MGRLTQMNSQLDGALQGLDLPMQASRFPAVRMDETPDSAGIRLLGAQAVMLEPFLAAYLIQLPGGVCRC